MQLVSPLELLFASENYEIDYAAFAQFYFFL